MRLKKLLAGLLLSLMWTGLVFAQSSSSSGSSTSYPRFFNLSDDGISVEMIDPAFHLGSAANRIAKGWFTALDTNTLVVNTSLSTPFTEGSAVFIDGSGNLAEDNTNFFWDDTNNRLGLGINVPLHLLHTVVNSTSTSDAIGHIQQDGTGDSYIRWSLGGSSSHSVGIDNSDSDSFKISAASSLATNTMARFDFNDSIQFFEDVGVNTSPRSELEIRETGGGFGNESQITMSTAATSFGSGAIIYKLKDSAPEFNRMSIAMRDDGTTPGFSDAKLTVLSSGNVGIATVTPNSTLEVNGTFAGNRTATAVSVNTSDDSVFYGVTDTSIVRTITLDSDDVESGRIIIIKDESGAAGTNNIVIDTEGAETIDGAASVSITVNFGVGRFYSNGTNWFTF